MLYFNWYNIWFISFRRIFPFISLHRSLICLLLLFPFIIASVKSRAVFASQRLPSSPTCFVGNFNHLTAVEGTRSWIWKLQRSLLNHNILSLFLMAAFWRPRRNILPVVSHLLAPAFARTNNAFLLLAPKVCCRT